MLPSGARVIVVVCGLLRINESHRERSVGRAYLISDKVAEGGVVGIDLLAVGLAEIVACCCRGASISMSQSTMCTIASELGCDC